MKNNCLECKYRHKENGNCTAVGGFCTSVPASKCQLLRYYLEGGLTTHYAEENRKFSEDSLEILRKIHQKVSNQSEDVVPVVRCKDCKHQFESGAWCPHASAACNPEHFCSYGERKEADHG